jgi:hypothetical protein
MTGLLKQVAKGKASIPELDALHGVVARELIKKIESGEFTAADLNVARQFLKDNGVEQPAVAGGVVHDLAATLPFAGAESYAQ